MADEGSEVLWELPKGVVATFESMDKAQEEYLHDASSIIAPRSVRVDFWGAKSQGRGGTGSTSAE